MRPWGNGKPYVPLYCIAGLASTQGEFWKEQRRFSHAALKDMGMGKSILEEKIVEELSFFIDRLKELSVSHFDPKLPIQMTVANVIENVIWGKRREYDDPDFVEYMDMFNLTSEVAGNGLLVAFPFLR